MRRRSFFVLGLLAALLAVGIVGWQRWRAARRMAAWRQVQADSELRAALEQPIELEGGRLPLEAFARLIAQKTGIPTEVDAASCDSVRPASQTQLHVDVPHGTFTRRAALRLALEAAELAADIDEQGLTIRAEDDSRDRNRLRTVVYPLPQPEPQGLDGHDWASLVMSNVQPGDWQQLGGERGYIQAVPGALIVVQTEEGHRQVARLLQIMQSLGRDSADPTGVTLSPFHGGPQGQQIAAALDRPARCEFIETPLRVVLQHLAERHQVPIVLITPRIEEAGVSADTPITKFLSGLSLRTVLELMLDELELTFDVRDEAIVVTTQEDAESMLHQISYPVADLIQDSEGSADGDSLIELVTSMITPDSWEGIGGPGGISAMGDEWLVVSQTWHCHRQVAALLRQLRAALSSDSYEQAWPVDVPPGQAKVEAALDQPVTIDFQAKPLKDACLVIAHQLKALIGLDAKSLEESGISIDTPVTMQLPTGRARPRIELMLAQPHLNLRLMLGDGYALVTSFERADQQLVTVVYDARGIGSRGMDHEELFQLIRDNIAPTSWDNRNGSGGIQEYRGLLVVSQTAVVHRQIEQLLTALETHCHPAEPGEVPAEAIVAIDPNPERERIESLLAQPIDVAFEETPFDAALSELLDVRKIKYAVDRANLQYPPPPITLQADGMTLGGVLDRVLGRHFLSYTLVDDFLWITPRGYFPAVDDIRLYWVGELTIADPSSRDLLVKQLEAAARMPYHVAPTPHSVGDEWILVSTPRAAQHAAIADYLNQRRTGVKPLRAIERERLPDDLPETIPQPPAPTP